MHRLVVFGMCLAVSPVVAGPASDPPRFEAIAGDHEFSGRMMVRPWQPGALELMDVPKAQADAQIASARALVAQYRILEYIPQTDEYIVEVPKGMTENDLADVLMDTGNFQYAHPDWIVYPVICPDDPRLPSQWHHDADKMDSCAAWDFTVGDSSIGIGICVGAASGKLNSFVDPWSTNIRPAMIRSAAYASPSNFVMNFAIEFPLL